MRPHLVHVFPAFAGGGPEVRTAAIINQSADRFRHTILSLSGDSSGRARLNSSSAVDCEAARCNSLWSLSQAIRSRKPDLVLTYGWGGTDAIVAARMAGLRRIVHTEDGFLDDEVQRQKWKRQWARRLIFKAAQALVVPSLKLREIAERTWRIGSKRLLYIPNGIDTNRFQPANSQVRCEARRIWGIPENALVVGIVGALRPEKNQMRLLDTFARVSRQHQSAWLLVVGDGPQREVLERAAQDHGIAARTSFVGSVRDPESCYHAMDILGLSSDTEQMPLTVLEGMAAGLPVVSTDVGDVRSMVCAENRRWVVPSSDPAAFADALESLLRDGSLRQSLGSANRTRCEVEFAWSRMLHSYVDLYANFASPRQPPTAIPAVTSPA